MNIINLCVLVLYLQEVSQEYGVCTPGPFTSLSYWHIPLCPYALLCCSTVHGQLHDLATYLAFQKRRAPLNMYMYDIIVKYTKSAVYWCSIWWNFKSYFRNHEFVAPFEFYTNGRIHPLSAENMLSFLIHYKKWVKSTHFVNRFWSWLKNNIFFNPSFSNKNSMWDFAGVIRF